jgi:glutathione S-transferase
MQLGLPHIFINVASGSANRASLERKKGLFQVPFISDPNTSVEMFESAEIVKYLEQVYTI